MKIYIAIVAFFGVATAIGSELKVERLGFRVDFPDSPGWTVAEERNLTQTMTGWSSHFAGVSPEERMTTVLTVSIEEDARNSFQDYADYWHQREYSKSLSEVPCRMIRINGHEACEFDDAGHDRKGPVYFRTRLVRVRERTYAITFMTSDRKQLDCALGRTYLKSFAILPSRPDEATFSVQKGAQQ